MGRQGRSGPARLVRDIERVDRRDLGQDGVLPSAGRAYATVENGSCNDFYGGITSAPASGPNPDLSSTAFPESGFMQQVDVYLDPKHPAGNETVVIGPDGGGVGGTDDVVFNYANSLCVLGKDGTCPLDDYRYFAVQVTKGTGTWLSTAERWTRRAGTPSATSSEATKVRSRWTSSW